ncbi:MAG: type IV toxin-antitoxin system AbiEi family antitoxin [Steroidobacteraceae bacterium]
MKPDPGRHKARQYVENLAARGRYHFTAPEAQSALGSSAAKFALSRLAKQGLIASPSRGFYVIVPPEYRSLGSLPADQFIPELMKTLGQPYYAGLLTAAQYHSAAHQRPQKFQVFLERKRLPIVCGKVRVAFMVRKRLREVPVQKINTPRGTLVVSSPEATALDLIGYQNHAGGLNQVATVLAELAEQIDSDKLASAAATAPIPWAQRLGYLLERVGTSDKSEPLKAFVRARATEFTLLLPKAPRNNAVRNRDWKLIVNVEVDVDV